MIHLVLVAAAVIAVRCAFLLRWPLGPCRYCAGTSVNKRRRPCSACGGTGQRRRFGATAVHRFWWSVRGPAVRERHKQQVREAREKAGHPE